MDTTQPPHTRRKSQTGRLGWISALNDVTKSYGYEYGRNGNILTETLTTTSKGEQGETIQNTEVTNYTYDENNQLTSTENSTTKWKYEYDGRGNIISKIKSDISLDENGEKVYTETESDSYTYDSTWKDKLTSYNNQSISYDASGNPTSYLGHNLTWTMGRQLASFDGITYTYNEDGIRTSKTSNGVTTKYYLDGTNIIGQTDGTNTLHFYYDSRNELIGFNCADNDYFYVKNQQGDITDIVDNDGNVVASYEYDPWGKVVSVSGNSEIGELNPFRYKSYYYDAEIQMYYLQSRYYDADVGRFINCDDVNYIGTSESEVSYNPFAYCGNNPVNSSDPYGTEFDSYDWAVNGLPLYTKMHNAVVFDVITKLNKKGYNCKPQVATYPSTKSNVRPNGYMDVYSFKYRYVWEIKRNNSSGISAGKKQLDKYVKGYVKKDNNRHPQSVGHNVKIKVKGTLLVDGYAVVYEEGTMLRSLVLYDFNKIEKKGTSKFQKLWNKGKKYVSVALKVVIAAAVIAGAIYYFTQTGDTTVLKDTSKQAVEIITNYYRAA